MLIVKRELQITTAGTLETDSSVCNETTGCVIRERIDRCFRYEARSDISSDAIRDTDGGGIPDAEELRLGLNSFIADGDGFPCRSKTSAS